MEINESTFITVLRACSLAGNSEMAVKMLKNMENAQEFHYNLVVDSFARKGDLEKGLEFIEGNMKGEGKGKGKVKAGVVTWKSLMSAARLKRNWRIAKICAEKVEEIDPNDVECKVLLRNMEEERI